MAAFAVALTVVLAVLVIVILCLCFGFVARQPHGASPSGAGIIGVRNLTVLLSVSLVILASSITGFLAIAASTNAVDDMAAAYNKGLDDSFAAARANVALINSRHMDEQCDAVVAKLAAYFHTPANLMRQLTAFVRGFPQEVTGDWAWINSTLRPMLHAQLRASLPRGVPSLRVYQPDSQEVTIQEVTIHETSIQHTQEVTIGMELAFMADPRTGNGSYAGSRRILAKEVWPNGWLPETWRDEVWQVKGYPECAAASLGITWRTAPEGAFTWTRIQGGAQCASDEMYMDQRGTELAVGSVEECARRCLSKPECNFFAYGIQENIGKCMWEKQAACTCPEGWQPDSYDTYVLRTRPERRTSVPRMSWYGATDGSGYIIGNTPCEDATVPLAVTQPHDSAPTTQHGAHRGNNRIPHAEDVTGMCSWTSTARGWDPQWDMSPVEQSIAGALNTPGVGGNAPLQVYWGELERFDPWTLGLMAWTYWPVSYSRPPLLAGIRIDAQPLSELLSSITMPEGSRIYVWGRSTTQAGEAITGCNRMQSRSCKDAGAIPSAVALSHGASHTDVEMVAASDSRLGTGKLPIPITEVVDDVIRQHAVSVMENAEAYNIFEPEELYHWNFRGADATQHGNSGRNQSAVGVPFLVKCKPLADNHGLHLTVVLLVRRDVVMHPVDHALISTEQGIQRSTEATEEESDADQAVMVYIIGAFALILIATSVYLAVSITAPLDLLRRDMHAVAYMELDSVDTETLSRLEEIRSMQKSFFSMVKSIAEYKQFLPQSVFIETYNSDSVSVASLSMASPERSESEDSDDSDGYRRSSRVTDSSLLSVSGHSPRGGRRQRSGSPRGKGRGRKPPPRGRPSNRRSQISRRSVASDATSVSPRGRRRSSAGTRSSVGTRQSLSPVDRRFGRAKKEGALAVPSDRLRVELRRKPVSLVCVNMAGYSETLDELGAEGIADFQEVYLGMHLSQLEKHHGIADIFLGDRLWANWNGARPSVTHAACATRCGHGLLPRSWPPEFRSLITTGHPLYGIRCNTAVVRGDGLCGSLGTQSMMRYAILSPSCIWVSALERLGAQWGLAAVIATPAADDARFFMTLRAHADVVFVKLRKQAMRVFELLRESNTADPNVSGLEWMYQIEENEGQNEWAQYNEAWAAYSAGNYREASMLLDLLPPSSPVLRAQEGGCVMALRARIDAADPTGPPADRKRAPVPDVAEEVGISTPEGNAAPDATSTSQIRSPPVEHDVGALFAESERREAEAGAIRDRERERQEARHAERMRQKLGKRGLAPPCPVAGEHVF